MFCYVILHYQNKEITLKCVEKLFKISTTSIIIIVDNCSPNGSGRELKEKFQSYSRVNVILAEKNEGFAKGNNIGFVYAKKTYFPDYIVVMNSDIFIEQKNFELLISKFMIEHNVDVCGPDIITPDGNHQNPLFEYTFSNSIIIKEIVLGRLKLSAFRVDLIYKLFLRIKNREKRTQPLKPLFDHKFNCVLHGACLVFGSSYIENENMAFLPITFLYGEEAILYDYLKFNLYRTGVTSDAKVMHMQGKSTLISSPKDRYLFKLKNITDSYIAQYRQRKLYKK